MFRIYVVGIDIGKRHHEASIIDGQGNLQRKSLRFANTHTGFNKLLELVRKTAGEDAVIFGMEATGHYWLALYTHLRQEGYPVHVINAVQSDALRSMYISQAKNNSRDSFIIAEVIRFGRFCETAVSALDLHVLRELCCHRFWIVDSVSALKRKVIALLDQVFLEYEELLTNTFGKTSLQLLFAYTTPENCLPVDTDKLAQTIHTASHGHHGLEKAQQIQDAARSSFSILLASDSIALLIRQYIEQIRFVETQIDTIDAEIARLLAAFDNQLTTITGIGPTLAAAILSEIGDVRRFDSPAKLAAFADIDLSVKQSGDFTGTHAHMSKRGSLYLRRAIWLAATVAAFKDPAISLHYQRKRSEGKSHLTALGYASRKMANIIFAVLRDNSPYSPAL